MAISVIGGGDGIEDLNAFASHVETEAKSLGFTEVEVSVQYVLMEKEFHVHDPNLNTVVLSVHWWVDSASILATWPDDMTIPVYDGPRPPGVYSPHTLESWARGRFLAYVFA